MHTIDKSMPKLRMQAGGYKGLHRLVVRAVDWLAICYDRSRERQALRALDDHLLRDIGLSRSQVWREARKSFWQE
ncbi:MAG TPA: DUF1127 domain-containing protein [Dongiaceae bacterium]